MQDDEQEEKHEVQESPRGIRSVHAAKKRCPSPLKTAADALIAENASHEDVMEAVRAKATGRGAAPEYQVYADGWKNLVLTGLPPIDQRDDVNKLFPEEVYNKDPTGHESAFQKMAAREKRMFVMLAMYAGAQTQNSAARKKDMRNNSYATKNLADAIWTGVALGLHAAPVVSNELGTEDIHDKLETITKNDPCGGRKRQHIAIPRRGGQ